MLAAPLSLQTGVRLASLLDLTHNEFDTWYAAANALDPAFNGIEDVCGAFFVRLTMPGMRSAPACKRKTADSMKATHDPV